MINKRLTGIIISIAMICTLFTSINVLAESITITIDDMAASTTETAVKRMRGDTVKIKGNSVYPQIIMRIQKPDGGEIYYSTHKAEEYFDGIDIKISSEVSYIPIGVYKVTVGYNNEAFVAYYEVIDSPVIITPSITLTLNNNSVNKGSSLRGITGIVVPFTTASLKYSVKNSSGANMTWGSGNITAINTTTGAFTIPEISVPSNASTGTYTLTVSGPSDTPTVSKTFEVGSSTGGGGGGGGGTTTPVIITPPAKIADIIPADSSYAQSAEGITYEISKLEDVGNGLGMGFNLVIKKNGELVAPDSSKVKNPFNIVIYNQKLPEGSNAYTLVAYFVGDDGKLTIEPKTRVDTAKSEFNLVTDHLGKVVFKDNKKTFADADKFESWSVNYIEALSARGFILGTEKGEFEADRNITRAELTAIIVRALELEGTSTDMKFDDISSDDWYSNAISIAYQNGVVSGYTDSEFKPEQNVSREEMVTMLGRVAEKLKMTLPNKSEAGEFSDSTDFEDYSLKYADSMQRAGIVSGKQENMFDPKAYATRAEVCKVIWGVFDLSF